jgi:type VI protein secretion system component VasK
VWWAGYIFAVGAVEVFRLNLRRALIVALLLLGLMALQAGALAAVGSIFAEFGGGPT